MPNMTRTANPSVLPNQAVPVRELGILLISLSASRFSLSCSRRTSHIAAELDVDRIGNIIALTGPDGKRTSFQYDTDGHVIEVI